MGVIRVPHNENFTTMANYHLKDRRLSLRAVGLMSKMLSLPDDWDYTVAGLAAICKEGREAVRKVLQELEETGYLERDQSREGGRFSGYDYTLHEAPRDGPPGTQTEGAGLDEGDAPSPGILGNGGSPSPRFPVPGFPVPENPPQLSTKESRTKNNPPKAPQGAARVPDEERKAAPHWKPERFEAFWRYYPAIPDGNGHGRRPAKDRAVRAWDKLRPDDATIAAMGAALRRQKESRQWMEGVGIPYASTWLNGRRWEEESVELPSPAPAAAASKGETIEWEN